MQSSTTGAYDRALTRLGIEQSASGGPRAKTSLTLSAELSESLRRAADRLGAPLEGLALAAWGWLLGRYSGHRQLLFGVVSEGQASIVVVIRFSLRPDEPIHNYIKRLGKASWAAMRRHRACPADASHSIDPLFSLTADSPLLNDSPSLRVGLSRLDKLRLVADFDSARYDSGAVDELLTTLRIALEGMSSNSLDALSTLDGRFRAHLEVRLSAWNDTVLPSCPSVCVHELFEAQAGRTPDAVAVLDQGRRLTYAGLNQEADRVADTVVECDTRRGDIVGVYLERTADAVIALLGTLKAGAAYAPAEPDAPLARVQVLLQRTNTSVVLTDLECLPSLLQIAPHLPSLRNVLWLPGRSNTRPAAATLKHCLDLGVNLRSARGTLHDQPRQRPTADPASLAYVLFTSGSTGAPKGVAMSHGPVVNLIRWVNETFGVGERDRVLQVTPLSFDLSVYSVFGALSSGASVYVTACDEVRDPIRLMNILETANITFWNSAPATLQQLESLFMARPRAAESALRLVFLSGDRVPVPLPDAVVRAFPGSQVVALGGPTETAIWSNYYRIHKVDAAWRGVPYGRPIRNVRCYVLDKWGEQAPIGVPGRLFVGGACLADGYLGDPQLTSCKFVPDPFSAGPGARLFDTGDIVRLGARGEMEFLGRADNQVKIRGYRVEPGEAEAALARIEGVSAAVVDVDRTSGTPKLVAFVVLAPGTKPDPETLRKELYSLIPVYAIPELFLVVDEIPITANGKVDRSALTAQVSLAARHRAAKHTSSVRTPLEGVIGEVWAEVLSFPVIDFDKSFGDNGGNSLAAARAVAMLNTRLKRPVSLRLMLSAASLRDFARELETPKTGEASSW